MLKLISIKNICVLLLIFFYSSIANSIEPKDFISNITSSASSILKENIGKDEKMKKLRELAENSVDIKGVGFYTLGKHRKTIDKSQLVEYEKLFSEYFLKTFSSRLSEYSDPKINVLSQKIINPKYTMVSSVLVASAKRPEVKIDWRVYTKNPDKPLIRDLIIEGLSLARTQKEEFGSVIQSADGDINVLFNNLREFNKN
tara:strand:+ start:619 stop:1218 length:600 start_codon:yes stop_codon:yes gene_type:complete